MVSRLVKVAPAGWSRTMLTFMALLAVLELPCHGGVGFWCK